MRGISHAVAVNSTYDSTCTCSHVFLRSAPFSPPNFQIISPMGVTPKTDEVAMSAASTNRATGNLSSMLHYDTKIALCHTFSLLFFIYNGLEYINLYVMHSCLH